MNTTEFVVVGGELTPPQPNPPGPGPGQAGPFYLLALLLALVLPSTALGQIDIAPLSEPHTPIVATVAAAVPEGATITGGWESDANYIQVAPDKVHVWAAPGDHTISYSGFWVHTESVTFLDGSDPPREITIQSYLGSGAFNESKEFSVSGGADPVDPLPDPDDPQPSGPKHLVFFHRAEDLDTMPPAQRYLINSLQMRKDLLARGHRLILVMDDDQLESPTPGRWRTWIEAATGKQLPLVGIANAAGGEIKAYPLPVDYKHLLKLLGEE